MGQIDKCLGDFPIFSEQKRVVLAAQKSESVTGLPYLDFYPEVASAQDKTYQHE